MMRDCEDGNMRDLLPGYVHGTLPAAPRAKVAAHLRDCADCAAEVELIASAANAFPVAALDIDKIVRALPMAPSGARPSFFAGRLARYAAAIGVIAIGGVSVAVLRGFFDGGATRQAAVHTPAPGTVLAATDTPPPAIVIDSPSHAGVAASSDKAPGGISFGGGISDLTDDQLNTLLNELDGLEALPSAEPETHLTPIVPMADGGHHAL